MSLYTNPASSVADKATTVVNRPARIESIPRHSKDSKPRPVHDFSSVRRLSGNSRHEVHSSIRDLFVAFGCTLAVSSYFFRFYGSGTYAFANQNVWILLLTYPCLVVACCKQQHLYRRLPSQDVLEDSYSVIKAIAIAAILQVGVLYIYDQQSIPRELLISATGLSGIVMISSRYLWRKIYERSVVEGRAGTHVLVVGSGSIAMAMAEYFELNQHLGYVFKGFIDQDLSNPLTIGRIQDLPHLTRDNYVDEVFVTLPPRSSLARQVIVIARDLCLDVTVVPELFEDLGFQAPLEYLGHIPIIELHREPIPVLGLFVKRSIDIALSTLVCLFGVPVIGLLALLIYLDSPGPIFYSSERVGKKGRTFKFHKLRSMVLDADARKSELEQHNERDGCLFKMANDPRVTRLGRFLRKYSIDELPQFWNVVKGEMSMVGPRPPLVSEYQNYRPEHRRRLDVVPGMTGLWQVSGRKDPSFEYYVAQDLTYIENWSLLLDLKILIKTIPSVLRGTGH